MSGGQQPYVRFREPYVYPSRGEYIPSSAARGNTGAYVNRRTDGVPGGDGSGGMTGASAGAMRNVYPQQPVAYKYPAADGGAAGPGMGGDGGGGPNPSLSSSASNADGKRKGLRRRFLVERMIPFLAALSFMLAVFMYMRCGCRDQDSSSAMQIRANRSVPAEVAKKLSHPSVMPETEHAAEPAAEPPKQQQKKKKGKKFPNAVEKDLYYEAEENAAPPLPKEETKSESEPETKSEPEAEKTTTDGVEESSGINRELLKGYSLYPPKKDGVKAEEILASNYARRIIVSQSLNLIFCPIPPAASTNWKVLLRKLEGNKDYMDLQKAHSRKDSGFKFLNDFSAAEVTEILQDSELVTFTFVRHPMHRMLSSYINKFTRKPKDSSEYRVLMEQLYGWEMVQKRNLTEMRQPGFDEFLNAVVEQEDYPLHEHWSSQANLCGLGQFPYDFVGKFENLEEDAQRLLGAIGRSGAKFPTRSELQLTSSGAEGLMKEMYTKESIQKLMKKQESDFTLLNYQPEEI